MVWGDMSLTGKTRHLWDQIGRAVRVRVNYTATQAVDYNYEY